MVGLGHHEKRYGTVSIVGCKSLSIDELLKHFSEHQVPEEYLKRYLRGKKYGYVWILKDARRLSSPVAIQRAYGAWASDKSE